MGVSCYEPVTHFSRGEYNNANNDEDDLAIINSKIPYITDTAGDDFANAHTLVNTGTIEQKGVIITDTDVDVYIYMKCN